MEPTYSNGQAAIINLQAYRWHLPQRGDVVGFRTDANGPVIVKRVIGLPGEQIAFHSGKVFINGHEIAEPYLDSPGAWEWPEETLPDKDYFVMGDNRLISELYRIKAGQVLGKLHGLHL